MTDLDLDDDLRTAFTAPRLDPALRARLLAPARPRIGANLALAAGILLTLGLAGVPAVELALTYATASGWVGAPRADLPMSSFDRWIPDGSLVTPYVLRGDDRQVFGVQRLIAGGDRMQLELLDAASWGDGPPGEVRLARIDGPLVELALPGVDLPLGEVVYDADRNPIEAVGRVPGALIVRQEGPLPPCVDCAGLPEFVPSQAKREVRLAKDDRIREHQAVRTHDATTGANLGAEVVLASHGRVGRMSGPAERRSVRLVLPDGERSMLFLPIVDGVAVWDRIALFEDTGGVLTPRSHDAEVVRRTEEGVFVSVPVRDVPGLVRAETVVSRTLVTPTPHEVVFELLDVDAGMLTLAGTEVVAVGQDAAIRLGAARLIGVDRSVSSQRTRWSVARALPPGFEPMEFRVVQAAPHGFRIHLRTDLGVWDTPRILMYESNRPLRVPVGEGRSEAGTVVQVEASSLEGLALGDYRWSGGVSADAPPAASSPPSPPADR